MRENSKYQLKINVALKYNAPYFYLCCYTKLRLHSHLDSCVSTDTVSFLLGYSFHLVSQEYFEDIKAEKGDNGDGRTSESCKVI